MRVFLELSLELLLVGLVSSLLAIALFALLVLARQVNGVHLPGIRWLAKLTSLFGAMR